VNKAELVTALAEHLDGDRKTAAAAVDGLLDVIVRTVHAGDSVSLTGFGVFERRDRAARAGRNPRTGQVIQVPATAVPAFRPGAGFRDVISGAREPGTAPTAPAAARPAPTRSRAARPAVARAGTHNASTNNVAPAPAAAAPPKAATKTAEKGKAPKATAKAAKPAKSPAKDATKEEAAKNASKNGKAATGKASKKKTKK
jgi:DNA-binding protein HU-beta